MSLQDFGARVASVWEGLRPSTRNLVERAFLAAQSPTGANVSKPSRTGAPYDARSEWELSRLLTALDERAAEKDAGTMSAELSSQLSRLAETCAGVLHQQARSAEVFAQLFERAFRSKNYKRVDALADELTRRLPPSEACELARHANPAVRAIAQEALLQTPIPVLVALLGDPVDAEIARAALEYQAEALGSEEARMIVTALNHADAVDDDI
jgi:hypothetical protein